MGGLEGEKYVWIEEIAQDVRLAILSCREIFIIKLLRVAFQRGSLHSHLCDTMSNVICS